MAYETYDIKTGKLDKYKGDTADTGIASSSIITPQSLTPEPTINIPLPAADNTNYQSIINEGNAYSAAATKNIADANKPAPATDTSQNLIDQYLKDSQASTTPSQADTYAGLYGTTPEALQQGVTTREADVADQTKIYKQAQDEFNLLDAEMKALNLEATAAPEQVQQDSIGRGRTKFATNVLTSEKLRNIALRSLPLQGQMYSAQAKVLNAQGNVEGAQKLLDKAQGKLDKVFELKLSDADRKYKDQKDLRKEVFGLQYEKATAAEKRKLDILDKDEERKYTENQDKLKQAQTIMQQAMAQGQADIASKIAQLDKNSPTYDIDLLNLQNKITPEGYRIINPADIEKVKANGEEVLVRDGRAYARKKPLTEVETYAAKKKIDQQYENNDFGKIGTDEEGHDIYGFIDKSNNKITPVNQIDTTNTTYTDASGNINNVGGWAANDASKVASMQATADRIGKLTNENIDEKVKQFAPGITGDMIKNASAQFGVSWEAILTQIVQEATVGNKLSNVAINNNNFGGLTASSTNANWYQQFNGEVGTARPESEGGNYIKFATKQDGVNALADLQAKYNSTIKEQPNKFDQFSQEQIALSVMPVQTRNSEVELKRALDGIRAGLKQGLSPYQIADNLMGYKINNPDDFSNTIRGYISQSPNISGNEPSEFARLINSGNKAGVVRKIESLITKGTDTQQRESTARYTYELAPQIVKEINQIQNKFGLVAGNWEKQKKKVVASPEFQRVSSELTGYVQEWRRQMSGTATTPTEMKMIEELLPQTTDNLVNLKEKIKVFAEMQLNLLNSNRGSVNLPKLDYSSLLDYNNRVGLYETNDDPLGIK